MLLNKNISHILTAVLLSFLLYGCSAHNHPQKLSPYSDSIRTILETSGSNRVELENFLSRYDGQPEKRQAAEFIVSNLPPADRAGLSADDLAENLDFAFLARESTPWGKEVSWTDFLHYVLPHRVSQEKAVNWRKKFYTDLLPLVSQCQSMEEAVLAVNRWCFSKTGFKSTQRWDQNPLMTINRGWGRCEEAVILTVCALRSVGIPARQAMVPAWQHSNDNHTWTEVQVDGKWHYIESANPDYGLDHAWFSGSVRKAPLVVSYAYGNIVSADYPILGRSFGCTLINSTGRYAPASKATIQVLDATGKALPETKIFISVLNYASFRPVAAKISDRDGKAEITLGPGSMLISAANGNSSAYVGSIWIPGEQAARDNILLKLIPGNLPIGEASFRFDYKDELNIPTPPKNSEGSRKAEFDSIKNKRLQKLNGMRKAAGSFSAKHAPSIAKAGLNTPQLQKAISTCPSKHLPSLLQSLSSMAPADLLTITADELILNARIADTARTEAADSGLKYDDAIFNQYVLNPRIMYEQRSNWRKELHGRFSLSKTGNLKKLLRKLGRFTAEISSIQRGPLGNSLNPEEVLDTLKTSTASEICIFNTAVLRSAGVPARYLDEQQWIEFYDGKEWQPFYPQNPKQTGNKNATTESRHFYSPWTTVKFKIPSFDNKPKAPQYFKDFSISRLINKSRFQLIEKSVNGKMNPQNKTWEISVPQGNYFLISVDRNEKNEPNIYIHKIKK
ncbi:transglutaminase domain-containing protein [Desulfovibrio sp. JC010]|uniref:transglutaminase domain-containing protein n=1 Tax=Desulfovibrio sp. JC010 TaxID=2593641 RepID=UPI0013D2B2A3|nr:transglutaminase domain-containing protein [Desulfovibrio sp. JC010]NDV26409.1 transglutaminase domain-containing protein [Desulfovibrio sp. JC010]